MRVNEEEFQRLASAVVKGLLGQGYVRPKVGERELVGRVKELFLENLRAEQALEQEAEQVAEQHARQMAGMDHRKIVQGIKVRLAKERGFSL